MSYYTYVIFSLGCIEPCDVFPYGQLCSHQHRYLFSKYISFSLLGWSGQVHCVSYAKGHIQPDLDKLPWDYHYSVDTSVLAETCIYIKIEENVKTCKAGTQKLWLNE